MSLPLPKSLERWPYPTTDREIGHCWLQDAIDHYLARQATRALWAIGTPADHRENGGSSAGHAHWDFMDAIHLCQRLAAGLRGEA